MIDPTAIKTTSLQETFASIIGPAPVSLTEEKRLKADLLDTPLGLMIAVADEKALYLLEFIDRCAVQKEIQKLIQLTGSRIVYGTNGPVQQIRKELEHYFNGTLRSFETPITMLGTPFQQEVWQALLQIPYGQTKSYLQLAQAIQQPRACRAVARANASNQLAIIIPCHRVINTGGALGGYAGGLERKKFLLSIEKSL